MDTFKDDLKRFVEGPAKGNKSEAARLLNITRGEVHAYLADRVPRTDKMVRLSEALREATAETPSSPSRPTTIEVGTTDTGTSVLAFQLVRYLYELLGDVPTKSRR